ncbi:MAG: hypothetical protein LUF01_06290 [Bacteroides sp.]|jgi:hypothetical protein|nr:hypothetical protein [Bacteroides sp.]
MPYTGNKINPYSIKGKAGEFVGAFQGIHIHLIGDNSHLELGSDRVPLRERSWENDCKAALTQLIDNAKGKPGYESCLRWLCRQLDEDHTPHAQVSDDKVSQTT